MTEQEKIIEELEKALISYKTEWYWSDKEQAKANIDRLIRKAEVYGKDPQIQQLLKKIKVDLWKFRIIEYCKNHKIIVGICVLFIICFISSFFGTMAGDKAEEDIQRKSEYDMVTEAINDGNFADAYEIIDNLYLNGSYDEESQAEKLNHKVLESEIISLLGGDLTPDEKATKIVYTIKDRAKYDNKWYDPSQESYVIEELQVQVSLLENAIDIAKTSNQTTVLNKLNQVYQSTKKNLDQKKADYDKEHSND